MVPEQPMGHILFIDASAGRELLDIQDVSGIQFGSGWHDGTAIASVLIVGLDLVESPSFNDIRHDDYTTPDVLY